jgi:hypothetical protein
MEKIDYKKALKHLYNASTKQVSLVEAPTMGFLMIDGQGNPNTSQEFQEAIEALFTASYTLKFMIKKAKEGVDYGVMPLEGLWYADDMNDFKTGNKDNWHWTLMIMQPDFITLSLVDEAVLQSQKKKGLPALGKLRFETFSEGHAAQIMHIGPYSEEGATIEKIHRFISEQGLQISGKHHEIYLSDPRKTAPEKLKTILRQAVKK